MRSGLCAALLSLVGCGGGSIETSESDDGPAADAFVTALRDASVSLDGATGDRPVTKIPTMCRPNHSTAADIDAMYKHCAYWMGGGDRAAILAAAGGNPIKVGYYSSFTMTDPTDSGGADAAMYTFALAHHPDWWLHLDSLSGPWADSPSWNCRQCPGAASCPPNPCFPSYDVGNGAYMSKVAEISLNPQNTTPSPTWDFVFYDNFLSPQDAVGLSGATVYSTRLGGLYSEDQQRKDMAALAPALTAALGGTQWIGNGGNGDLISNTNPPTIDPIREAMLLAPPVQLFEYWLVDIATECIGGANDGHACGSNSDCAGGRCVYGVTHPYPDDGTYSGVKNFDAAWLVEQRGHSALVGAKGQWSPRAQDDSPGYYQAAALLLIWRNAMGWSGVGGDFSSAPPAWFEAANLGMPLAEYACLHGAQISPTPPADVVGPLGNVHCGGGGSLGGGVWWRPFERGEVYVNMSGGWDGNMGTVYQIETPTRRDLRSGATNTTWTLAPKTGLLLVAP